MGELVRGLAIVAPTAKTTTGTGTAVSVGAVAEGQRLVARLHIIAKTGSGTLDVVLQSDSAEGMSSPTTRITFDQVSAIGSQTKEISSAVTDTWYRESRTITSGSFTYVVSLGVAGVSTGVEATLPPAGQESLVLASPLALGEGAQAITMLVGSAGQLGSTAGSDTNDPTYGAGPPPQFAFDANDYITWGDILDTTFEGAFSIMVAAWPDAGDLAADRMMLDKDATGQSVLNFYIAVGKPRLNVYYSIGVPHGEEHKTDAVITAGKRRLSLSWDPALARAVRTVMYVDGALVASTDSPSGSDGVIAGTTASLRQGLSDRTAMQGVSVMGPAYIWNRVLTAGEMLENANWLAANGW